MASRSERLSTIVSCSLLWASALLTTDIPWAIFDNAPIWMNVSRTMAIFMVIVAFLGSIPLLLYVWAWMLKAWGRSKIRWPLYVVGTVVWPYLAWHAFFVLWVCAWYLKGMSVEDQNLPQITLLYTDIPAYLQWMTESAGIQFLIMAPIMTIMLAQSYVPKIDADKADPDTSSNSKPSEPEDQQALASS